MKDLGAEEIAAIAVGYRVATKSATGVESCGGDELNHGLCLHKPLITTCFVQTQTNGNDIKKLMKESGADPPKAEAVIVAGYLVAAKSTTGAE